MMQQPRIAIMVCLAEPLLQAGVHASLAAAPDMQVLAADADPAHQRADVAIADYATAIGMVRERRRAAGGDPRFARILIVSAEVREHAARRALEQGVYGIVLTGSPVSDLLAGIRALFRGDRYLCPEVAHQFYQFPAQDTLTSRQDEVLQLLAKGHGNKSIALRLDIEVETVRAHVKAILNKLNARCRTEAASIATERGLITYPSPHFGA